MHGATFDFECRVYFEDTDAGGVVYNANYLKFYERARTEYLRSLGFEQDDLLSQNIVFVVRNITVDFVQAARFNEMLLVETRIDQLKKASLMFSQEIFSSASGHKLIVNSAQVKVVCVNADNFKPTAIPSDIYEKLKHNE
jgi:acyl-CoA thioester hydrolase